MVSALRSLQDVVSSGFGRAAHSEIVASAPLLSSQSASCEIPFTNCACAACFAACDRYADGGNIPTNAAWWFSQRKFAVGVDGMEPVGGAVGQ